MKKIILIGLCVCLFGLSILGCRKKQEALEQTQVPLPPEISPVSVATMQQGQVAISQSIQEPSITMLPQGPYKPTNKQIQTALKNAGYYSGEIDGIIGPKTSKAIKDFQIANKLDVDGKVGPKTWSLLSKYLKSSF